MKVPLLDLKAQYKSIKDDVMSEVTDVFDSQYFILGPKVEALESAVAEYSQTAYAVGVSSGSDALIIAMMSEGVKPGDEIITSPYTFFATGGAISRLGAKMVFVDIDPVTFNMDVSQLEEKITEKTVGIVPVHLYGQMAEMNEIIKIANEKNLWVIEDAAQSIGASYKGRKAGSMGDYGCFSFFPSKNLGGAGDGGMVVMQDKEKYESVVKLRNHGMEPKYYHALLGGNFRLDALQAAVLKVKLPLLDSWGERRRANAARYRELFFEAGLDGNQITTPFDKSLECACSAENCGCSHIYNQFIIRCEKRDALKDYLTEQGVGCDIYYPVPMHLQECFVHLGYRPGDFPESERAAAETLALPIYPELTDEHLQTVVNTIKAFYS